MDEKYLGAAHVLHIHFAHYPEMEPQDAVKLLYQSEFGCGHFLPDPEKARAYLLEEWKSVPRDPGHRKFDTLDDGLIRVHLEPIETEKEALRLAEQFISTAEREFGSPEGFRERLAALRDITARGIAPFSSAELEAFLAWYIEAGCPAVHHSEGFRKKYHPAYRVIKAF